MNEKENKKSTTKRVSKWITKLDTLFRNIVLVVIAIALIIITNNSHYLRKIYYRSIDVRVINTPDVNVENTYDFPTR